jgi:hypothetical protein
MPAPLGSILAGLWVPCIAGAMVIVLLTLDWTGWMTFAVAALVGLAVGVPAGIGTARQIKREDPGWPDGGAGRKADA